MCRTLLILLFLCLLPSFDAAAQADHGFRFVRVEYDDVRGQGRRWGGPTWRHDYPTAEYNFYEALERTTKIDVVDRPLILDLSDDRIFDYPILYLCEPGFWALDDEEAENLREYLARGGFIIFDDFRGRREWDWFYSQMKVVLPDKEPQLIPPDHPVWSVYYDVDPVTAPSLVSGGRFSHFDDQYYGYFDDDGRMVALVNFNQDIGDGWEWPDRNFENASTISFQMGVNYLVYALTH